MPCQFQSHISHRPVVSIPLCLELSPPIFLQLYLPPIHISFSRYLFQVLLGCHLRRWPYGVHCSACFAMLSSLLLNMRRRYDASYIELLRDFQSTVNITVMNDRLKKSIEVFSQCYRCIKSSSSIFSASFYPPHYWQQYTCFTFSRLKGYHNLPVLITKPTGFNQLRQSATSLAITA